MSDYADLAEIVAEAKKAWIPPPKLTVSQWADEHFRLSAESAAEPGRWHTLPYQRGILDAFSDPAVTFVWVIKSARVGFALALNTPIPTKSGWTTMGDVQVGDNLFDEAGRPCRVLSKSQVYSDHVCFRVRFCDGSEIIADAGHRWAVESDVSLEHLASGVKARTGRPKPGQNASFSGVVDTETMSRIMRTSRGRTALTVRNAAPLETQLAALPVPPYTLGLWLGDGHMVSPRITQHRSDVETALHIEREGIRVAVGYPDARYPNNATYWLDCKGGRLDPSPWASKLRGLGVISNKHIPPVYLRAHVTQRLELLRGLMDSDGTITANGRAEFNNTNENLAWGVHDLVSSLGMKVSIHQRDPVKPGYLPQWRVNFKPTPGMNPFRLSRKAARVEAAIKPSITFRRRIVSVERTDSVPVQCIEVDSPSHLFLAGRSMIPTHNTKCLDALVGYHIHQAPCPILVIQPTVEDAKGYSKEEIAPMLRDVPALSKIVFEDAEEVGPRDSGNTILHKKFPGGLLSMAGANSGAGFRRVSRKVVLFDEVDAYPPSAGSDGDQIKLGTKRAEYYWDRKIGGGSTPLIAGHSRIESLYLSGDQRRYYVPCPHCKHMDYLVFTKRDTGGHWLEFDSSMPEEAHFVCSSCDEAIEHKHKREMVEAGEWRAAAPFTGTASFHIWTAYSYSPNATWADIAKEFLAAKGDPEKLRTFINTTLGETWKAAGEAPEWERLYQRREDYAIGSVPPAVICLTAGVDVQKDRFVWEVVGWGHGKESWSIDCGVIPADTANSADWSKLDQVILNREFLTPDGTVYTVATLAVDSGFNTQQAYSWARRHPLSRVIAIKGSDTARTIIGSPTPVDVKLNGQRLARGYKVWPVGSSIAKTELYGWLKLPVPSFENGETYPQGFCHFPEYGEDYFKQLTGEHMVSVKDKKGFTRLEWQMIPTRENHYLDCRVYARAAATLVGLDRMAPPRPNQPVNTPPTPQVTPVKQQAPALKSGESGFLHGGRAKGWLSKKH